MRFLLLFQLAMNRVKLRRARINLACAKADVMLLKRENVGLRRKLLVYEKRGGISTGLIPPQRW